MEWAKDGLRREDTSASAAKCCLYRITAPVMDTEQFKGMAREALRALRRYMVAEGGTLGIDTAVPCMWQWQAGAALMMTVDLFPAATYSLPGLSTAVSV